MDDYECTSDILFILHRWERIFKRVVIVGAVCFMCYGVYKYGYHVATEDILTYLRNQPPKVEGM